MPGNKEKLGNYHFSSKMESHLFEHLVIELSSCLVGSILIKYRERVYKVV